jgi:hypothetical protein
LTQKRSRSSERGRQGGGGEIMRDNEGDNECNSETNKQTKTDLRNVM